MLGAVPVVPVVPDVLVPGVAVPVPGFTPVDPPTVVLPTVPVAVPLVGLPTVEPEAPTFP